MNQPYHIYYQDSDVSHITSVIIDCGKDCRGNYFIPDQTIFHPEEAGQPEDRGVATIRQIHFPITGLAINAHHMVKHYTSSPLTGDLKKETVALTVDLVRRRELARWHTAGHLIKHIIEQHRPELIAVKESHFPGHATLILHSLKKKPFSQNDLTYLLTLLTKEISAILAHSRPIIIDSGAVRKVHIEGVKSFPCKGIYVKTTADLRPITIEKVHMNRKSEVMISYSTGMSSAGG
ncbi:MAG: hypothetical protein AAF443_05765 [Chlamydiota bacterium]